MKEKIFTRDFCLIMASMFFSALVTYMLMTTITEHATSLGFSVGLAGFIAGIYVIGGLVSRLYSGGAQARIGWKKIALAFWILQFIACCCYFLTDGIASLLIVRFLHGLGFGAGSNALLTGGTYILPKSRYGEAMGYLMLPITIAIAIGPFVGGIISDNFGGTGCFTAGAICAFFTAFFVFFVKVPNDVSIASKSKDAEAITARGLNRLVEVKAIPVSVCIAFMAIGYSAIISFYRLYAQEIHLEREFSAFFIIYAFVLMAARPLMGMVQDRKGDNLACLPGLILQGVGLILVAACPSMLTIAICAVGCAFGYGSLSSAIIAIVSSHAHPLRRSYAVSTFYILCDVGMGIGPLVLGAFQTMTGSYQIIYYIGGILALAALPWYFLVWGRKGDTARK